MDEFGLLMTSNNSIMQKFVPEPNSWAFGPKAAWKCGQIKSYTVDNPSQFSNAFMKM